MNRNKKNLPSRLEDCRSVSMKDGIITEVEISQYMFDTLLPITSGKQLTIFTPYGVYRLRRTYTSRPQFYIEKQTEEGPVRMGYGELQDLIEEAKERK